MIYFRGCTAREKLKSISDATEHILKVAEVDYHILPDEKCCGSVLLRTGFIDEAENQIAQNIKDFKGEVILTSCAGCYKTFKEDYPDLEVIHISQLLKTLIDENKIKLNRSDLNVTYHDPCHLGRHCSEFDAPREVISKIANLNEMTNIKENAICCGSGGGVKSAYPEIASSLSKSRIEEALSANADLLITTCPFCKLNLDSTNLEVLDLTEFLVKYGGI